MESSQQWNKLCSKTEGEEEGGNKWNIRFLFAKWMQLLELLSSTRTIWHGQNMIPIARKQCVYCIVYTIHGPCLNHLVALKMTCVVSNWKLLYRRALDTTENKILFIDPLLYLLNLSSLRYSNNIMLIYIMHWTPSLCIHLNYQASHQHLYLL